MVRTLFRTLFARPANRTAKSRRRPRLAPPAFRPGVETLEGRVVPSTIHWANPAGGDWDVAANWSPRVLPGPGDDAVIDMPGSYTVTHAAGTHTVHSVTSEHPLSVSGGSLTLAYNATLTDLSVSGGMVTGGGYVTVTGLLRWTGGTIAATGSQPWIAADGGLDISGPAAKVLAGRGLDVRGSGTVSGGTLTLDHAVLTNFGGSTLDLRGAVVREATPYSGMVINTGHLRVFDGLTVNATDFRNYDTVEVFSGSLTAAAPTARVINNGQVILWDGLGGFNVNGESYQQGAVDQAASITGPGSVYISVSDPVNYVWGQINVGGDARFSGSFIFNFPDVTVTRDLSFTGGIAEIGAGSVSARTMTLDGSPSGSVILRNTSLAVSLEIRVAQGFLVLNDADVQTNTFTVQGASNVNDSQVATRATVNTGTLSLFGSTVVSATEGVENDGLLLGAGGTIAGDLVNNGTLDFGVAGNIGALTVTGNYTQTAQGTLRMKLGGSDPQASSDQLTVGGLAQLDGQLVVSVVRGYQPAADDAFQLITAGTVAGNFAGMTLPTLDGYYLDPVTDAATFSLVVRQQS